MIKIAIVDDKQINRNNIVDGIKTVNDIEVVFTAQNGEEFLEKMKPLLLPQLPHIVIMDIDMPEKNGIETVRDAKVIYPNIEFLMFTVFDEDEKIFEAIKAGASGYLLKDESITTIINFIRQVKEFRAVPMSPAIARKALKLLSAAENAQSPNYHSTTAPSTLTPREKEVLRGLVEGLDYKEIADKLFVSPNTVRNQISSIYQKLHVSSKVDAVKLALKNKLV